jgi:hypothetical protein
MSDTQLNGGGKKPSIHTVHARARSRVARHRQPVALPDYQDDGIRFTGITEMSLADWIGVPDHPHQRDTVKHAFRSAHLRIFSDSHRRVSMAVMADGRKFKGDGHTRTYMWVNGMTVGVPTDLRIIADTYELADETALGKFYELYDNKQAVDTLGDEVTSASKAAAVSFNSHMMKTGRYVSALRFVHGLLQPNEPQDYYTLRTATAYLARELMLFDSIAPTSAEFNGGIMMAAFLTLARDGVEAVDFWRRYQEGRGWKMQDQCDAVEALRNFRSFVRRDKQSGSGQMLAHFRHAMSAYFGNLEKPSRIYNGKNAKPRAISDDSLWKFVEQTKNGRARLVRPGT